MNRHQLTPLDREIAEAEARVEELKARKAKDTGPWPKRCKLYVHGSKESNYDAGEQLGLSGEALDLFMYTACEVELIYEVQEDGSSKLLGCNRYKLIDAPLPEEGRQA